MILQEVTEITEGGRWLSNLNGVDYGLPLRPAGQFVYTKHQDQITTRLDGSKPEDFDTLDQWEPLRQAAVSCGAFPFAFGLVDLVRHGADYGPQPPLVTSILPGQRFTYTDGGTFQNEPLGMAKNLVDEIDNHQNSDSRFYLYVSPSAKNPLGVTHDAFNSDKASYVEVAGRLLLAIFQQARYRDWIEAERVNDKIDLFNARAKALHDGLLQPAGADGYITAASLQPMTDSLLPLLFQQNPAFQKQETDRLRQQFGQEYQQLTDVLGAAAADTYIATLLTLETAAQIGRFDEMKIYGITAEDSELASFELAAFAGFFDRSYRDHDYDVGRQKAQTFLQNPAIALPGEIGPIRYTPQPINEIDEDLNGLTMDKMDREVREKVRDRVRDRVMTILEEMGVEGFIWGPIVREGLNAALITPELNKVLKL